MAPQRGSRTRHAVHEVSWLVCTPPLLVITGYLLLERNESSFNENPWPTISSGNASLNGRGPVAASEQGHVRSCSLVPSGVYQRTYKMLDRTDDRPAEYVNAVMYIAIHAVFEVGSLLVAEGSKHAVYIVLSP